jgi:hypothetical protein
MLLQTDREDLLQTEESLNLPILTLHKLCQQRLLVPENNKTKTLFILAQQDQPVSLTGELTRSILILTRVLLSTQHM